MTWEDILKRKPITLERVLKLIIGRYRIPKEEKQKLVSSLLTELSGFPDDEDTLRFLADLFGSDGDILLFELTTDLAPSTIEIYGHEKINALVNAYRAIKKNINRVKIEVKYRKEKEEREKKERERPKFRDINDMLD